MSNVIHFTTEDYDPSTGRVNNVRSQLDSLGGTAGGQRLAGTMEAAGARIDDKQKQMTDILSQQTITAADTARLNVLNNDISLLASAQKSLNQAAGAAQKSIAA